MMPNFLQRRKVGHHVGFKVQHAFDVAQRQHQDPGPGAMAISGTRCGRKARPDRCDHALCWRTLVCGISTPHFSQMTPS
jgi:hypothetical protein